MSLHRLAARDPSFWGARQPVGPVALDRTHPLARGLVFAYTGAVPINLVTGEVGVTSSIPIIGPLGAASQVGTAPVRFPRLAATMTAPAALTVVALARTQNVAAFGQPWLFGRADWVCHLADSAGNQALRWQRPGSDYAVATTTTAWRRFAWRFGSAHGISLHADGVLLGTGAWPGYSGTFGGVPTDFFIHNESNLRVTEIAAMLAWTRILSVDEVNAASFNPWQLLVPAGPARAAFRVPIAIGTAAPVTLPPGLVAIGQLGVQGGAVATVPAPGVSAAGALGVTAAASWLLPVPVLAAAGTFMPSGEAVLPPEQVLAVRGLPRVLMAQADSRILRVAPPLIVKAR